MMSRDELRIAVSHAFANVPTPQTREEMFFQLFADADDAGSAAMVFGFRPWKEIPIKDLFAERAAFGFLSPMGFRAYLPAYLTACLATEDPFDKYSADIMSYTVLGLMVSDSKDHLRAERIAARNAVLDATQRAAVTAMLEYLAPRMQLAKEALDEWNATPIHNH